MDIIINVFKSEKGKEEVIKSYNQLVESWDTEVAEVDLKTKYGITHCITTGDKRNPPLLLLHGVGDNSAVMWILNIKGLSKHFYCIAVDTLGGPGKSIPNDNYKKGSFDQVDWINDIVELLEIKNFNIAGVSNGACMAFNYAVTETDRINKVICLEGGMILNPFKTIIKTLLMSFPELLFPTKNNLLKVMRRLCSPNSYLFQRYPEVAEHMIMVMKNHNQKAMFVHNLEKYDENVASKVRDKLYFLIGGYRVETKKDFIVVLDKGGYKYKIVKDAGHAINHEQPELINNEIIGFLLGQLTEV